jgi:threonylcarbamoyladenosine tRNA methylthiotransferase MtaB
VEGIERYRISSIEPNLLTDEIIEYCAQSRAFMPHFHIPLQSGCDEVLKLMHRKYDTALFAHKIEKIRSVMPDAFVGVDVIVGTRGETPEYFDKAYDFMQRVDVSQYHVFSYSERAGTKALEIPHVVTPQEKHDRSQRVLALSAQKTHDFYARFIGTTRPVLLEHASSRKPFMNGFTDNYIRVEVPNHPLLDNQIVQVKFGDFNQEGDALIGEIVN